eukprot:TRINITY_DN9544_c1_g2_i1.p1 TRINITY_DN9544_c1_g2~~TRINITY_DN9544_c1_g2_i1.p1  ORF type:complete len:134 (-),score=7.98 TRINITY_DN9544_c1_g2_i1:378-779(-)
MRLRLIYQIIILLYFYLLMGILYFYILSYYSKVWNLASPPIAFLWAPFLNKIYQNIKRHATFPYFNFGVSILHVKCFVTYGMAVGVVLHANFGRWGVHVAIDSAVGDALRTSSTDMLFWKCQIPFEVLEHLHS